MSWIVVRRIKGPRDEISHSYLRTGYKPGVLGRNVANLKNDFFVEAIEKADTLPHETARDFCSKLAKRGLDVFIEQYSDAGKEVKDVKTYTLCESRDNGLSKLVIGTFANKPEALFMVTTIRKWDHTFIEHDEEHDSVDLLCAVGCEAIIYTIEPSK